MIDLVDGFITRRRLEDQRLLSVQPLLYGRAQLGIGPKPPMQDLGVFADSWDFPSIAAAMTALNTWNPAETPEPDGWHRHPETRRYRIEGRADLEYVKGDSNAIDEVKRAILVTHGQGRVIREVNDEGVLGKLFPQGSRSFRVLSESSECKHDPRCQWIDVVYHYLDRYVVVRVEDLQRVSVGAVLRRLTDNWPS